MELRHLRYFVNVAQELNFTKAAQKLRVAQPALSRQIRALEEEVGVSLLDRNSRGVELTEAGKAFFGEARMLLAQSEQAIRTAQKIGQASHGPLNIGYTWGLFHSLVPSIIEQFRRLQPETAVNLFDMTATEQAKAIAEGRIDSGFIGFAYEADHAKLAKAKVSTCEVVAVLPKNHRASKKPKVELSELSQDLFLTISEDNYPGAAHVALKACEQAGFRPKVLQTAERGHTILGLVAGNCGVALLPEPLKQLPHSGVVFRPLASPVTVDLFVAWEPSRQAPLRDALLKLVEQVSANSR